MIVVVMGPSGSGKTAIGTELAHRLGVPFLEGDTLHSRANVAKMRAGRALTDADRVAWLNAVADWIAVHAMGVVACSALKRTYRDRLRRADPGLTCVLLVADRTKLAARVADREGHFMPLALLDDQLRTLEPLAPDERGFAIDNEGDIGAVADAVANRLERRRRD